MPAKWEGIALAAIDGDRVRLLLSSDNDFLVPELRLRRGEGEPTVVPFTRAARTQDTWIIEVETLVPPLSASRNAVPSIIRT